MHYIVSGVIAVVLLVIQHYLSKREHFIYGGILPLLTVLFSIWFIWFKSDSINTRLIIPGSILCLILLGVWCDDRILMKRKREDEINKMRAKDLDATN